VHFPVLSPASFTKKPQEEGMQAEQKKTRFFGTQPKKKPDPGRMAQTPRAGDELLTLKAGSKSD